MTVATIIATPYSKGRLTHKDHIRRHQCSDDVPKEDIGYVAKRALEAAWRAGHDPVNDKVSIVITFE